MQIDRIYGVDASLSSLKIAGKVWSTQISIYKYPTKSSFFQMWKCKKNALPISAVHSLTSVVKKIVKINMSFKPSGPVNVFFVSMLHE